MAKTASFWVRLPIDKQQIVSQNAVEELLLTLASMVNQHCMRGDGVLSDFAISANEEALDCLERAGIVEALKPDMGLYKFTDLYLQLDEKH